MDRLNRYKYKNEVQSRRFNRSFGCKQQGITAIAMVFILILVAFFALIAIRLMPVYIENFSVRSHLKQLASDSETKTLSDKDIYKTLRRRFQIDDVKNVADENITIDREAGKMTITIEYEVRTPALGNVDMVVYFNEEAVAR